MSKDIQPVNYGLEKIFEGAQDIFKKKTIL